MTLLLLLCLLGALLELDTTYAFQLTFSRGIIAGPLLMFPLWAERCPPVRRCAVLLPWRYAVCKYRRMRPFLWGW